MKKSDSKLRKVFEGGGQRDLNPGCQGFIVQD